MLWRPPGAHLYGGGGRNFEIVSWAPDRVPVALGLSAGLVHSEKCEKVRNPTTGRWCFGRLPLVRFVWAVRDPYLSASKACVRADSSRCGRLEAGRMLSILARFKLAVPREMATVAKKKGLCSYTIFIDRLRELDVGVYA